MADQQKRGGKKIEETTGKRHGTHPDRPAAGQPGGPKPNTGKGRPKSHKGQ